MLFVFLILFFCRPVFSEKLSYDLFEINEDELTMKNGALSYNIFQGSFKKLKLQHNFKTFYIENLFLSFKDNVNKRNIFWDLKISETFFDINKKKFIDVELTNNYNSIFFAKNITIDKEDISFQDVYFTPKDVFYSWKFSSNLINIEKDTVNLINNKFSFFTIPIPLLNIEFEKKPSSGFILPNLKKYEVDGFILRLPYYFYINEKSDLQISPFIGNLKSGFSANYKKINEDFIFYCNGEYFHSYDGSTSGGLFNFKKLNLKNNVDVDFDLIIPSNEKYSEYWYYREHFQRNYIPSYFYYSLNDKFRVGFNSFFSSKNDIYYTFLPKIEIKENFLFEYGKLRTDFDFDCAAFLGQKNNYKLNGSSILSLKSFSYLTGSIVHQTEAGLKFVIKDVDEDYNKITPFFIHSLQFNKSINSDLFFNSYLKIKLKKDEINNSIFITDDLSEFLNKNNTNGAFKVGADLFYKNFNLGLSSLYNGHTRYEIIDFNYVDPKYFFAFKRYNEDNSSLNLGFLFDDVFSCGLAYLKTNYRSVYHDKVAAKVSFSPHYSFDVNCSVEFAIKPISEFSKVGIDFVFKNDIWIFKVGFNIASFLNKKDDVNFTFVLELNGLDEMQSVYNKISNVKTDIDFEQMLRKNKL